MHVNAIAFVLHILSTVIDSTYYVYILELNNLGLISIILINLQIIVILDIWNRCKEINIK